VPAKPDGSATLTPTVTPGSSPITSAEFDNGQPTKDVLNEGTWNITVDPKTGQPTATFTPKDGFTGTPTPQKYTVADKNGLTSDPGELTVTKPAPLVPPTTGDASKTINPNTKAEFAPGDLNTVPGSGDITDVKFDDPAATDGGKTLVVPNEGTWTISLDSDGKPSAEFTPLRDYSGPVTEQSYTVTDSNDKTADGTLNVTINEPPSAKDKSATTDPSTPVTLNPETGFGTSKKFTGVAFDDKGATTKDVPNEGTWTIKLDDKGQPEAVFTPVDGFTGKTTAVPYIVTDENGLTATANLDVTVNKPLTPPTTGDKSATTNPETPVTLNPVTTPGSAPIKSVVFDNGQPKKVVPGQGTWTVELKDGQPVVVFTPEPGCKGSPDPQQYTVTDANGKTAKGTLKVTISKPAPAPTSPTTPKAPAAPGKVKPAPAAPAEQPQSILASTGASVGIALIAMLALAAAGLGLRKLSRRNGSD
jgi:CshA-type fibril repeat protein